MADSPDIKLKQLKDRIADLERSVGRKQMEIDYLSKMIELGEEHFNIPIKKKLRFNTLEWFRQNRQKMGLSKCDG